jgi:hypothetical protein
MLDDYEHKLKDYFSDLGAVMHKHGMSGVVASVPVESGTDLPAAFMMKECNPDGPPPLQALDALHLLRGVESGMHRYMADRGVLLISNQHAGFKLNGDN